MTREETVNYLNKYRFAQAEASRLEEQLMRLKSERVRITPRYAAAVSSGGEGSRMERFTEKIICLENMLWDKRIDCVECHEHIEKLIDKVENEIEKRVLRLRYIEGLGLEQIALQVGYSHRQIIRIHNNSVKNMSLNVM